MAREKTYPLLIGIIFITITIFFISQNSSPHNLAEIKKVRIAGRSINVELALTPEAQTQGLSDRKGLTEDSGMLFVFSQPDKYYFWMKDMDFPLDIVWIGEDMKVIYIKKDASPASYPNVFGPESNSKYVLEIVGGFSDTYDLKEGATVRFTY